MRDIRNLLITFFGCISLLAAQTDYHHPELDWYTLETEHFQIHYHQGAERTARVVAKIAQDIYDPVTDLYDWEPDGPVHFIIKDHDDISNGAAYYYDNKVEIWAPQMTFILRGTHNWLRNVVTHEFSHMISLGAARKMSRHVPAFYFQWINYEKEKRPDVLYGYPNEIASYAVANTIIPMWLAEGMAQYMAPDLDYDRWDTHRDMLIRTAVLDSSLHSFTEMGVFGKNSIGNERTYNAGYALTRYIAHHFGPESMQQLTDHLNDPLTFSVNAPINKVTGLDADELYKQWHQHLIRYYQHATDSLRNHTVAGEKLVNKGIGNIAPVWSPDGRQIAYCGSPGSDYLTLTSLKVMSLQDNKTHVLKSAVNSKLSWSPDSSRLLYARKEANKHHSHYNDLYVYNLETKKEIQLTRDLRVMDPVWMPDGKRMLAVQQADGTDNLVLIGESGKIEKRLTNYRFGQGVYGPSVSADGRYVVFSRSRSHGRNLLLYDFDTEILDTLISEGDARDPFYTDDGRIFFSWDRSGIADIYSIKPDQDDLNLKQWTRVLGGAFMPAYHDSAGLAFSLFDSKGYKISVIRHPEPLNNQNAYQPDPEIAPELWLDIDSSRLADVRHYDDTQLPDMEAQKYGITYGDLMFMPRVMIDSNQVKLGTYFYANEILDRLNVFGGVGMNARKDLDAFLMFEWKKWRPTLFTEFYAVTRNVERTIAVIEDYPKKVPVDISFRLLEGDIGARYQITDHQTLQAAYVHSQYMSHIHSFFFEPQGIQFESPANTYFYGNHLRLNWDIDQKPPSVTSSISPSAGRQINVEYSFEWNRFFEDFSTEDEGVLPKRIYTNYNYNKIQVAWHEYLGIPFLRDHSLNASFKAGYIDRPVDSFFNFYAGGLPGLRGYPFYSIEGRKMFIARFNYRLPLFTRWQKQFFHLTTNHAYLTAFMDVGDAFDRDAFDVSELKKDVGLGLRLSLFSFYGFPTALSVEAAYGLDTVYNQDLAYGNEWRYYVTLLFDFMN
ncbi:MAG: hypothetical protein U5R06_00790 [candidate division KSB1 bacterium]|nr:hypothetical protein [candidate division KSB1 bacterium]